MTRSPVYQPESIEEALAAVKTHAASRQPLLIAGRSPGSDLPGGLALLQLDKLQATSFFQPDDMVVGVEAGMPFTRLNELLATRNMCLPVNPWYSGSSVGGMIAANRFGPDRRDSGGIRDFLIGIEYASAQGCLIRGGGRVVKNVTGYDLCRMMVGSRGELGPILSANFKIMPQPQRPCVLVCECADWPIGFRQMRRRGLPIDWAQVIYQPGRRVLGIGYSGPISRSQRIERELTQLFEEARFFTEEALPPQWAFFSRRARFGGFLQRWLPETPYLHLFGIVPPGSLLSTKCALPRFGDMLSDPLDRLMIHPDGGDFHFVIADLARSDRLVCELKSLITSNGGFLTCISAPSSVIEQHGRVMPVPQSDHLNQKLRSRLDPHQIFRACDG